MLVNRRVINTHCSHIIANKYWTKLCELSQLIGYPEQGNIVMITKVMPFAFDCICVQRAKKYSYYIHLYSYTYRKCARFTLFKKYTSLKYKPNKLHQRNAAKLQRNADSLKNVNKI